MNTIEPPRAGPQPPEIAPASSPSDCASPLIFTGVLVWVLLVAYGRTIGIFLASAQPGPALGRASLIASLAEILALGLPLLILSRFWRNRRYQAVYTAWMAAAVLGLFLLPVQWVPPIFSQGQALLHIVLAGLFLILARLVTRRGDRTGAAGPERTPAWVTFLAGLFVLIAALPWIAWGAPGSLLDFLLDVLAALSIGAAAAWILLHYLFEPQLRDPAHFPASYFLDVLAAGGTLVIVASLTGFPYGGMQLLLMIVLPAATWGWVALLRLSPNFGPLALLIGGLAAAPMVFFDPDELALVISFGSKEVLSWALQAAGTGALLIFVFSLALVVLAQFLARTQPPGSAMPTSTRRAFNWVSGLTAGGAVVAALAVLFLFGKPGNHGEKMFVILKSQPDVSAAQNLGDVAARRRFVYDTLVKNANETQSGLRQTLKSLGIPYAPYYLVNGLEVPNNPILRLYLQTRPEVDRVLESPTMRPLPEKPAESVGPAQAPTTTPWNLQLIHADQVVKELGVTGKGIVIGQSDSGVQGDHPELAGSYRGQGGQNDYNWLDPWFHTQSPSDIGGHGTHTLGTVLGKSVGVAPGATWMACVNLARNLGDAPLYLNCWQFMLAPYPQNGDPFTDGDPARGANVLNNSWGCPEDMEGCDANSLLPAVRALRAAGTFVEVSAGNSGPACSTVSDAPAIYGEVYSTGAIDRTGALVIFSSRGPVTVDGSGRVKPDILAPGLEVLSAFPGSTYAAESGTSMAGPHVAGVVALMWSSNPKLIGDIARTEEILNATARPYTGELPDCPGAQSTPSTAAGYGILDAYAAVQMALSGK